MDKKLFNLIRQEVKRQQTTLDLIPSENIAPPEVLAIVGSPLINKYSEGYPGRRYYPGNSFYNEIEELAKKRALQAFTLSEKEWHVNVQPYSGSPANFAIYAALMEPKEVLMGLSLSHGGHLTHGHAVSFSGKFYESCPYELDVKTGCIDYENLESHAKKYRPKVIVSGATAYPRKIDFARIGKIARASGAYHVADISHVAGLIAAGVHPSPFSAVGGKAAADVVMTTTHKTLRGPRGAVIFANRKSQIANRNRIDIAAAIDKAVFPGLQGGPHNNVTAAIAWTFGEVRTARFKRYARQVVVNARALAAELIRDDFDLLSGGTDNHLMLIDLRDKGMSGADAERKLESGGIIANRNAVPGDLKPYAPSGIRMGTPAATSRGMGEREMQLIASFIRRILIAGELPRSVRREVEKLCAKFPLPYRPA